LNRFSIFEVVICIISLQITTAWNCFN